MASGTLPGNLTIIRETGIYGTEIREAIASAIEQADSYSDGKIDQIRREVQTGDTRMSVSKIAGTDDDYLLTIENPST